MAFGFSKVHEKTIDITGLTKGQFLALALEAAKIFHWDICKVNSNGFVAVTDMTIHSYGEEVILKIHDNTATISSRLITSKLLNFGTNKYNIESLIEEIESLKIKQSLEALEQKEALLPEQYTCTQGEETLESTLKHQKVFKNIFSIFVPVEGYFITPILIIINILAFIAMSISGVNILMPDSESLLLWGANFSPLTLNGEAWRLFTSCFLHIGILHLLLNMYALAYIGVLLEPVLGRWRFISAYILCGLIASASSITFNDLIISAGASGAIFGMYGVFLALLTTKIIDKTIRKTMLSSILIFVFYNLVYGLKPDSGIDNAAHIGGLLSGLAIGYAFLPSLRDFNSKKLMFSSIGIISFVVLMLCFTATKTTSNDAAKYQSEINRFVELEEKALLVFQLPEGTPDQELLNELNKGIGYWEQNIGIVDNMKDLDLPETLKKQIKLLREYCQLRISSYQVLYKSIKESSNSYDGEINEYNKKIEGLLNQLNEVE